MQTKAEDDPDLKLPARPHAPDIGMSEEDVANTEFAYSVRAKDDWVVGGPLGMDALDAGVKGRWFNTWVEAEAWARSFYGSRLKGRKPEEPGGHNSWAFIIRGPRG